MTDEEVLSRSTSGRCPIYTILVPLYREAAVVARLAASIAQLDYPQTKLDVMLLCEEDDEETIDGDPRDGPAAALQARRRAGRAAEDEAEGLQLRPASRPTGKYVVIFDAEDRPEPDQLKKVVLAFAQAPRSASSASSASSTTSTATQNLLTRWFTTEYSLLVRPAAARASTPRRADPARRHVEPLHHRARCVELGAWDPFNVTEDADLGIRLHKAGYKTAIVDSTTFEEANSDLYNWIRQRSRWVKGYIQTWLVHMRHPSRLLRQIGCAELVRRSSSSSAARSSLPAQPDLLGADDALAASRRRAHPAAVPELRLLRRRAFGLFIGNFVFMYLNVAGSMQRGYYDLVKYALLSPLYWALMSIGAWKGFLQLFYRPFYWEKTVHGLDVAHQARLRPRSLR